MADESDEIRPGKYVEFDFVLVDDDGDQIQDTKDLGPLCYVHGYSPLVPGLHDGLEGMAIGDEADIVVPPEKAYGTRDDSSVIEVDRSELPDPEHIRFGDEIIAEDLDGQQQALHVVEVLEDVVMLDTAHPLAGATLTWSVHIRTVRQAKQAEIDQARTDSAELEIPFPGTDQPD